MQVGESIGMITARKDIESIKSRGIYHSEQDNRDKNIFESDKKE